MGKWAAAVLVAVMLIGCPATPVGVCEPAGVEYRASPTVSCVVRIRSTTDDGLVGGTGFVVRGGDVYTAWHVVKDAKAIKVMDRMGFTFPAKSWAQVGEADVARIVMAKPLLGIRGLELAPGREGEVVEVHTWAYWGVGHSDGLSFRSMGVLYPSVRTLVRPSGMGGDFYAVGIPVGSGMSGAPLICHGKVIGVCSFGPAIGSGMGYSFWARLDAGCVGK